MTTKLSRKWRVGDTRKPVYHQSFDLIEVKAWKRKTGVIKWMYRWIPDNKEEYCVKRMPDGTWMLTGYATAVQSTEVLDALEQAYSTYLLQQVMN